MRRPDFEMSMMMLAYLLAMGSIVMTWRVAW